MNEQSEELSVLMDDFQQSEQDQSVLNDVLQDVNHQYTMRRYQMIGEVMRNEMPESIQLDFAAEVMSQIEQEPVLSVQKISTEKVKPQPQSQSSWFWSVLFKPVAGIAVAATVAFVAISSLQLQPMVDNQSSQVATADSSSEKVKQLASISFANSGGSRVSAKAQRITPAVGMNWKIKRNHTTDVQKKLNTYLVNHNEFSNSLQGIIPQARVVGFDAQK